MYYLKRTLSIFLLIVTIISLSGCDIVIRKQTILEHEHVFEEENNYIITQKCSECDYEGRLDPLNTFENEFEYTFSSSDYNDITKKILRTEILLEDLDSLTGDKLTERQNQILENMKSLEEYYVDYLEDQYVYAKIKYDQLGNNEWSENFKEVQNAINNFEADCCSLEYKIFCSSLKETYFEGEDLEEIEKLLLPYKDEEIGNLQNKIDDLEFDLSDMDGEEFLNNLTELIDLRQDLATKFGYSDYYEYANKQKYSREYKTSSIKTLRDYVSTYIAPIFKTFSEKSFNEKYQSIMSNFMYENIFYIPTYSKLYSDYLKTIKDEKYGIDFFTTMNNAFKDGRIFRGFSNEAAYTYTSKNLMYLYNGDYYSSLITIVHETGHFMFGEETADLDTNEVHSQSNEVLFLKYYLDNYTEGNKTTEMEELFFYNKMYYILLECAVDEIEEAIYKNYSLLDTKFMDGITTDEYEDLEDAVSNKYGVTVGDYWNGYITSSSCYEIGYVTSFIPCITLYIDSVNNYDNAKESFYKALTYIKDPTMEDYTLDEVLDYAGYDSPFNKTTYEKIQNYFN